MAMTDNFETNVDNKGKISFVVGTDYTVKDYDKWKAQIALWINKVQVNKLKKWENEDPVKKAEKILAAAINGTKLNGEIWGGVESFSLRARVKQLCGWDIKTETGRTYKKASNRSQSHPVNMEAKEDRKKNQEIFLSIELEDALEARENYKHLLYQEFPSIENPVYEAQVNALAEAVVKLEYISSDFLLAKGSTLESFLKIRNGLKTDINDFMKQLKIHPEQLKDKVDNIDSGDVGSLINKWEEFGEIAEIYEKVDAVQELIQTIRQVEQLRLDGSPQLADYLLWHRTGTRPYSYTCSCGKAVTLYDGFTEEELYAAAESAFKAFGFGIKLDEPTVTENN